jgi:hypothetical protein
MSSEVKVTVDGITHGILNQIKRDHGVTHVALVRMAVREYAAAKFGISSSPATEQPRRQQRERRAA